MDCGRSGFAALTSTLRQCTALQDIDNGTVTVHIVAHEHSNAGQTAALSDERMWQRPHPAHEEVEWIGPDALSDLLGHSVTAFFIELSFCEEPAQERVAVQQGISIVIYLL